MIKRKYQLEVNGKKKEVFLSRAYCIGYTGRNKEKTYEHIKELADIGIPEPKEVPMLYPVSINTAYQEDQMDVLGKETSGEAEIVMIFGEREDEVYVTVGSDHTDRNLESVDINKSKQVCGKPFAKKAWNLSEVIDHWEQLELSSEVYIDGEWVPYQKDTLAAILPHEELMEYIRNAGASTENSIFFSGTVPLLDGFKYGTEFKMAIRDPVVKDEIKASYTINNIERE